LVPVEAAAADDAMKVRMENEIATPGMDDGGDAKQGPEPLRIAAELQEGLGSRVEQKIEKEHLVGAHELAQFGGESEDNVEMAHGQRALHARRHPTRLSQSLALGAMTIAARVVDLALASAIRAHIAVSAECTRAADRDVPQRSALPCTECVSSAKRIRVTTEQGSDVTARRVPPPA
jgi:hypothetical protein